MSLISVGSKLLSNVILFRLRDGVYKVIREEQCSYKGPILVWYTRKIHLVKSAMYVSNAAAVKVGNEVSSWFRINSGVKQSCVLSPII